MYTWGFVNADLRAVAEDLPPEGLHALLAFVSATCLNPPEVAAPDAGKDGWPMPTLAFGPRGEGMVCILVVEEDHELLITQIAWLG